MANGFDWLEVESLDLEAQGVAHRADGKVVFIEGALPGERVQVNVARKKNQWEQGQMSALARESAQRVRPGCPHFGLHAGACGGCKMQHLHPSAQVAVKQRVLEDNLWHLAKVRPERILRPIEGPAWGYRDRARLSVRFVAKKGAVLIGFHERKSRYVADMQVCPVLPPRVSAMLLPLRELVGGMDQRDRLPQIELAVGDGVTALVLRHLEPLSAADVQRLRDFGAAQDVQWWLQPKGPESVHRLDEGGAELAYRLPEYGITLPFKPTDFTQVNAYINRVLVDRAVRLLDAQPQERVIDWFCGLGNFTLPLATRARQVLGVEGSETLVARARDNARLNGLAARTTFEARNLFEIGADELRAAGPAERWLVDPPREGAFALAKALAELHGAGGWAAPARIVYVSCNPATLARDAGLLVHQAGYRCSLAGVVNMFPHTAHTESMAVFDHAPP
ncbi:MAG: 23S rRNA (uracil(1939)-C(5))-methyltransferase RlmD [Rubrivivax sp.]|jgi:23S rRNA (uracil1939-C5)-methyltransferase|nr:23S rRNA (uracil(1939)-C(5))-methyltransferase RlmD [Betaproteobacteria bacterium]MBP9908753.1 23S rRNA (uracil(1939)-C(5))-methyltransferase RlmD [Rubrivivax sp.]MBK7275279.1 23S rRNA (uracil(1939)-C(5))-methyltransferase RlmD [Betaproteobacteria bacterium]MBK7459278.1 23S rRNA (uracil(1939)-C(5))-methyltransferase RlmD [Betaproteobacteria bacterium]MBK7514459.1 23S rRNA (uracil(1939)-C(5))-methyltransferase RlmD [Betaproteobacteria bacterium]